MKFFTADLHFGHENIITSCKRPFKNATHMDKTIVRNWNRVVGEEDWVYVVGDVSMMGKNNRGFYENIMRRLKGYKVLVGGNHDVDSLRFLAGDRGIGFVQVAYPFLLVDEFLLWHDPVPPAVSFPHWPAITGHVHTMWHTHENCFNCGVDVNGFTPVSEDAIRQYFLENTDLKVEGRE